MLRGQRMSYGGSPTIRHGFFCIYMTAEYPLCACTRRCIVSHHHSLEREVHVASRQNTVEYPFVLAQGDTSLAED